VSFMAVMEAQIKSIEEFNFEAALNHTLDYQKSCGSKISDYKVEVGGSGAIGQLLTRLERSINLKQQQGKEKLKSIGVQK